MQQCIQPVFAVLTMLNNFPSHETLGAQVVHLEVHPDPFTSLILGVVIVVMLRNLQLQKPTSPRCLFFFFFSFVISETEKEMCCTLAASDFNQAARTPCMTLK